MPPTVVICPMIATPQWQLPSPAEAPGSWFLLVALALVALAAVRWLLAPLPAWRARIIISVTYGVGMLALLGAVLIFTLAVPAYQEAAWREFWSFQPTVSPGALSCALGFQEVAHRGLTVFQQGAAIFLGIALLSGAGALWLRAAGAPAGPCQRPSRRTMLAAPSVHDYIHPAAHLAEAERAGHRL